VRPLTFFHTAEPNVALFGGLMAELAPDIPTRHVLETEPLQRAVAAGKVTSEIALFTEQRILAALADDPAVLVCTCSTIGGVVDHMAHPRIPLLRIDRPMARLAVDAGNRVLIAACVESTIGPTRELIESASWEKHPFQTFSSQIVRIFDAWPFFLAGDKPAYWQRIAERLREASPGFDAIVLAQASMAGAADLLADLGIPVISSPRTGVQATVDYYRQWTTRQPDWIDRLIDVLESLPPEKKLERICVKMAICCGEQIHLPIGQGGPRRVRFEVDEYLSAPGGWELMDGLLHDRQGWPPRP
jgi:Asp/Glu/hydantoin racemase